VHPRENLDLGREGADVGQAATVDADLVAQDALPDEGLGDRAEGRADLLLATLELTGQLLLGGVLDPVQLGLALLLGGDRSGPGRARRSRGR
jgi:hypothetical protein